jgi:alpha-tubulin suppressor-like RCC1 family protein
MSVLDLSNVVAVAAGESHNCALLADHTLRCWGNGGPELGVADYQQHPTPVVSTTLNDVTTIAVNGDSCAIRQDTTLWCWGDNNNYALAQKNFFVTGTAVQIAGLAGVVNVALGIGNGCAVLSDGTARCWGSDTSGQLGDGQGTDSYTLVNNGLTDVTAIAMGNTHGCALHRDGTVSCWGSNYAGQLGSGPVSSATTILRPAKVAGLTGVVALSAGGAFACALGSDTRVRCWGANTVGEMGIGTMSPYSLTPVVVKAATQ